MEPENINGRSPKPYWQQLLEPIKPLHQYHDLESIHWTQEHRPMDFPQKVTIPQNNINTVKELSPWLIFKPEWFAMPEIRDGIHGSKHVLRVAIYSILLASDMALSSHDAETVMYAALLHDCQRHNDNADEEHGKRAEAWIRNEGTQLLPSHMRNEVETIATAVGFHNDDYTDIEQKELYLKNQHITDILKTADGIDRYRFPKEKWWFDPKYSKLQLAEYILPTAFDLALASEELFLQHNDAARAISEAWQRVS